MRDETPFISVVIPTRDRRNLLEKCLEALRAQPVPPERFEIVVVDDGSSDGTGGALAGLAKRMPNLRCFPQPRGGPAKARNRGVREARGPIILFTGDDCVAHPRLLEEHGRSHRRERGIAVLGRIDWHPDLEVTPFMEYIGRTFQFTFPLVEQQPHDVPFGFFYTSNISVAKEALLAAGLFDEEFADAVCEDAELGYRLARKGIRIVYNRRAITYHCHAVTLEDYIRRQIRQGKAAALFYRKHPELAGMLRMEQAVSPETREAFYSAVLTYYAAVGMQLGLGGGDEKQFLVPMEEILKGWSAKVSDRLLGIVSSLRHQNRAAERRGAAAAAALRKAEERIRALDARAAGLEKDLAEHRAFARRVTSTLAYRVYKSLRILRGEPPRDS